MAQEQELAAMAWEPELVAEEPVRALAVEQAQGRVLAQELVLAPAREEQALEPEPEVQLHRQVVLHVHN